MLVFKAFLSKNLAVFCVCLLLSFSFVNACKETCGRSIFFFFFPKYTMCHLETQRQVCSMFRRSRLRNGYACGPCHSDTYECPAGDGTSVDLENYREGTTLNIRKSKDDSLCTLWIISKWKGRKLPVARSYYGNDWEAYSGQYARQKFDCKDGATCASLLPKLPRAKHIFFGKYTFQLSSYRHSLPEKDEAARFLEQATFGPSRTEIENFASTTNSPAAWIKSQQEQVEMSSHRAHFREHWNHKMVRPSMMGISTHACEKGTRYRKYAFSDKDRYKAVEIQTDADTGRKTLLVDGQARTVLVNVTTLYSGDPEDNNVFEDGSHDFCKPISSYIGARLRLYHTATKKCLDVYFDNEKLGNPPVFFDSISPPTNPPISLVGHAIEVDAQYFQDNVSQELYVESSLDDLGCNSIPPVSGLPDYLVAGEFNGEYWLHDPRFDLHNNTQDAPKLDGGGRIVQSTKNATNEAQQSICMSAPMTFLNEEGCILTSDPDACGGSVVDQSAQIELTLANFERAYEASGHTRYIYTVTGLRQDASEPYYLSPCTAEERSRWIRVSEEECNENSPGSDTVEVFSDLLRSSADENLYVRDVFFPTLGRTCNEADQEEFNFRIMVDGDCWKNVHRSHLQVYDFTTWVSGENPHPGGPAYIQQFAEVLKDFTLAFPSNHNMERWHNNVEESLVDLGRLGDQRILSAAPTVAEAFQDIIADPSIAGSAVVCGSPGEIANKKENYGSLLRGAFDSVDYYDQTTPDWVLRRQRVSVWMDIVLKSEDQLRQKVAWALSQIVVVSADAISSDQSTECFVAYYDIFVRNAFGNYRDILKEVSYSPLMAQMLSYLNSQSTAYVFQRRKRIEYADENYAREVMQLFSIGLYKLNNDGTWVLDNEGQPIQTYTNDDITEYARLWTGFQAQLNRGNIELDVKVGSKGNFIDPMRINILTRDNLPKMGLDGLYIGEGMPLCSDLPNRHFLKPGATYLLLGSSPQPKMLSDPDSWSTKSDVKRLILTEDSALYQKLCNNGDDGSKCDYAAKVVLEDEVDCTDMECEIESPRVIEVEPGLYYEYARVPCVNQAFFEDAKLMKRQSSSYFCGDPRIEAGAAACCTSGSNAATMAFQGYDGERMTFSTAKERCESNGLELCEIPYRTCDDCDTKLGHWTSLDCQLKAKIDLEGRVAIVHSSSDKRASKSKILADVRENTKTFFRVDWTRSVEDTLLSNYERACSERGCSRDSYDNLCLCPATVSETTAFSGKPSRDDALRELHIGAFPPNLHKEVLSRKDLGGGVVMYSEDGAFTSRSIFEVIDGNGIKHFRKNVKSTVLLGDSSLAFRNPPHIMSITNPETRDAHYETDAGIDHYLFHPNTAPFLAIRFAQRFGISNPSPRYVDAIATAFRTGYYRDPSTGTSFGSGKYGDLGAMVAALLLDRESRTVVLDADPAQGSILEPFSKFVRVMRSLEFEADADKPFLRFDWLLDRIGQEAHDLPDVFSFFLPEYAPAGPISDSGLVCPECQVLTGPKSIELINGLLSLLKYGLDSAYGGFGYGRGGKETDRKLGVVTKGTGSNFYEPLSETDSTEVVDELSTLLTSGRLAAEKRATLIEVYDEAIARGANREGLINIQQLILTAPEFHSNSISRNDGDALPPDAPVEPSNTPYKAVIYLMLSGGMDSYNMLVPQTCHAKNAAGMTVDDQYNQERGDLAFTAQERTLTIGVDERWGQPCSVFALHDELTLLKELYDDGDLVFFANTGILGDSSTTQKNFKQKTQVQLFAHNAMQREAKTVDPWAVTPNTGILGRLGTTLSKKGYKTSAMSIDNPSIALERETGAEGPEPLIVSKSGFATFDRKPTAETLDVEKHLYEMNAEAREGINSVFGDTWSLQITKGIRQAKTYKGYLENADELGDHWPSTGLPNYGKQFSMITKLINTAKSRGSDRDFFYTDIGGWDHHSNMKDRLRAKFLDVNQGLSWLTAELKHQGVWKDVTIVVTSDFGRTVTRNSGGGSDHAWSGHYWMMGGDVDGGKILGKYPDDITKDGPLNVGRGRMIPSTSWDAIWNGISQWLGADTDSELDYCLPTRKRTTGNGFTDLMTKEQLFKSSSKRNLVVENETDVLE